MARNKAAIMRIQICSLSLLNGLDICFLLRARVVTHFAGSNVSSDSSDGCDDTRKPTRQREEAAQQWPLALATGRLEKRAHDTLPAAAALAAANDESETICLSSGR